ncbi:MAG: YfiR family protein [Bacteroidales bacterium]|nr:YfiR family protein [Bacteroidales bacterium]
MKQIVFIVLLIFAFIGSSAQSFDNKLAASYLFGFGRMLHWQSYQDNQIVINVYGTSSVTDYVNNLAVTNRVSGRKVIARETGSTIGICNILFIPADKMNELDAILPQLQGKSVLVVAEKTGYLNSGVDVEFGYKFISRSDSVVSYKYNSASIINKNIKISPEFTGYSITD